jgi:hypothetical protein
MEKRPHAKIQKRSTTLAFRKRKRKTPKALEVTTVRGQPDNASIAEIIDTLQERSMIVSEGEITFNVGRPIKGVIRFKSHESMISRIKAFIPSISLPRLIEWLVSFLVRITSKSS